MKYLAELDDGTVIVALDRSQLTGPLSFDRVDLGQSIRDFRHSARMTQAEFAEKSGISRQYVSMLEQGNADNPSLEIYRKVMSVLLEGKKLNGGMKVRNTALHKAVVRSVDAGYGDVCSVWLLLRADNDGSGVVPFDVLDKLTDAWEDDERLMLAYARGDGLFWDVDEDGSRLFLKAPASVLQAMEDELGLVRDDDLR